MILAAPLETPRLLVRTLEPSDIGSHYLSWLSDPEVIRYMEIRFSPVGNLDELAAFVLSANASKDNLLLGIFQREGHRHVGNIKLGPIHRDHHRAEIGFLIGAKDCWGRGYATEAISAVARYGLDCLNLRKVTAGCYETNVGSARALVKAGFTREATIPWHVEFEGRRVASILFGMNRDGKEAD